MSEHRRSGPTGDVEKKSKDQYLGKTNKLCPTCGRDYLYVKTKGHGATDLECPNCDQVVSVPQGTENF